MSDHPQPVAPATLTPAHSRLRSLLLRVGPYGSVLLGASAILLVWIGAFYFSHSEQHQTEEAAFHNAVNLSRTFEENIIRSVRTVDQTLLYVRDTYARDPEHFDMSLWQRNQQFLADITFQIALIDRKGIMVASNIPGSVPGVDLGDREHFKVHAQRETDELFISKPVLGRVSNKWSIQLTRRITMPDGSFGGVVVVSLDPAYLSQFYESIDVGEKGSITLLGADGIIRARGARGGPSVIGQSIAGSSLEHALQKNAKGFAVVKSQLDGIDRMLVYRDVRGYPLTVVVGLAKDEVFAVFDRNKRVDFAIAIVLTLWLLGITYLMARYYRILANARDAAEAGTRARSEFLAMMSHEIRTPMNGVMGMADLLLESGLQPGQAVYAKTLRESAEHLVQILNDVLDFSKLEADRVEIEHIGFDLHSVVRDSASVLRVPAQNKGLDLKVRIADDVPAAVTGDPARLRQVLFNLVGNGLKFTKSGHVAIDVTVARSFPDNCVRVQFAVSDTGIGIPHDGLALLFREFSQLDSSIARRFGGTGLGLAICKRLVDLMGGTIKVESQVGNGTTFRVEIDYLAQAHTDAARGDAATAAHAAALGHVDEPLPANLRILLVEDNKTNQLVATKLLQGLGYACDLAENGVEAVNACGGRVYDVVFMDMMMPEMDGLTATRTIRQLPKPNSAPHVIALTANAQTQDQKACTAAGMNDFLAKPVNRDGIRSKLIAFARHAQPAATPEVTAALSSAAAAPALPAFDENVYETLQEALGPDDSQMVLEAFLADTATRLAEVRGNGGTIARDALKREAHSLKSSAATLGFARLSALARKLEAEALAMEADEMEGRLSAVLAAFHEAEDAVTRRYDLTSQAA